MKKAITTKKSINITEKFKWKVVENSSRSRSAFAKDEIVISLKNHKNGHGNLMMKMGIKIGSEKASELGFVSGDRILVMYDEDDLLHFLLVKSNTNKGYKLTKASEFGDVFFNMKWNLPINVHEIETQVLDHEIVNGHITFRVPQ